MTKQKKKKNHYILSGHNIKKVSKKTLLVVYDWLVRCGYDIGVGVELVTVLQQAYC